MGVWEDFLLQSLTGFRAAILDSTGRLFGQLVDLTSKICCMVREKFLEFSPYWWHYTHISKGTCREYQFILEFWCQNLCNKSSWLLSFSSSSTPKSTFSIYIYIQLLAIHLGQSPLFFAKPSPFCGTQQLQLDLQGRRRQRQFLGGSHKTNHGQENHLEISGLYGKINEHHL